MAIKNRKTGEKISFRENFKNYLNLAKKYKWTFAIILGLATIVESIRVFDKFLFKVIIDDGAEFVAENITSSEFISTLWLVAVVFGIAVIIKVISNWTQIMIINRVDGKLMHDLKKKFFNHIVHLSHNFHTTHKTGSLISRMNRGDRSVESITDFIVFDLTIITLQIVLVGGALLFFDPISAVIIVSTAVAFVIYGFYMSDKQQAPQQRANRIEDIERGTMADIFTNIDSIKYFGKENVIKKYYERLSLNTKKGRIKFWDYHAHFRIGESLILAIGTFLLFFFPLTRLLNGELDIGTLAFIYTVYLGIMGPLFGFVHGMRRFYVALGDLDSLYEYDKEHNEIIDNPDALKLKVKQGEIKFKNIDFGYHKNKIIKNLSLSIKPGEKVALVGHSGSGKTTMIKLLYRFYDVSHGGIYIDGKNIREFNQESLRSELSIVPQECVLFDDTIFNNIKFSNQRATKEDIEKAMKFAQLDKFVRDLPLKEKTIVGERGVKLSGGEKQRVSIARALLADKKILVLDEATSALDSKTESEIQKDLEKLMQGRTSIIIAHRLSTIMSADKIVVMEKGRIVQIGKHNDLIKKKGTYKELWDLQKGGYIE